MVRNSGRLLGLTVGLPALWMANAGMAAEAAGRSGEIRLSAESVHPAVRQLPSPVDGKVVDVNPPPLLWPAQPGGSVSYDVRLSTDPGFPADLAIAVNGLGWAMFNPHQELAPGTWHWHYRAKVKGKQGEWSETFDFVIPADVRTFATPSAQQLLATCPESHPRVLATSAEIQALRARAEGAEAQGLIRRARRHLGARLPDEASGKPKRKGKNASQAKKFANWASKALGTRMGGSTTELCMAYVLTGDERLGAEAVRHGLHVAGWDPDGVSRANDFSDGACLRAMALVFDTCQALLTDQQKQLLLDGINARAGRFYRRWRNQLETRVFNAHIWQHILHDFIDAAFATVGELPEAEEWVTYAYELWLNRVPLLGGNDGGWANGNNYFGTNFASLVYIPALFKQLTGVDFFSHPWYRNVIYYQIYSWPPNSQCDGFGDGSEKGSVPGGARLGFLDVIGGVLQDPSAGWYIAQCLGSAGNGGVSDSAFRWYRLRSADAYRPAPTRTRSTLPQARAFADIGVVTMHTDLAHTERNLMLAFRSSPYGSTNHMHADQNSFNILYGGKRIFSNSGYYIAYGDEHFRGWYKHSVGHNTVLIDGKGQVYGTEGYGWVPRFLHGERITYCVGAASNAYGGTGLTRFRRHILMLRPSLIIVYDDLVADHDAEWTWLLHSGSEINVEGDRQRLRVTAPGACSQVDLLGSVSLKLSVDTRFDPPADNWRGTKNRDGTPIVYADQWHVRAESAPVGAMRILALVQVMADGAAAAPAPLPIEHRPGGWLQVGDWAIRAELQGTGQAFLEARHNDGLAAFSSGGRAVVCDGESYEPDPIGSSLLVELAGARKLVRQAVDELPAAAR